jgi:inhibitor of KinA
VSGPYPRIVPFGERAFLVEFGNVIDESVNARVHGLAARLSDAADVLGGLGPYVPAYASLLVPFDPGRCEAEDVERQLRSMAAETVVAKPGPAGALLEIAVRYGGDEGADLPDVASRLGITEAAVIDLHAGTDYRVFMLGFAPGFAYLGPLPEPLRLPRRGEPRLRVPAGSVAIAAAQTAVYPHVTAGGWHLLGHTDAALWDPDASQPASLRPGDRVRFVPV